MAQLLKGAPVAQAISTELKARVEALAYRGVTPTLAIVRVGQRDDDLAYERAAMKRCDGIGIRVVSFVLPATCSQDEVLDVMRQVNEDPSIHGCLLLRPLPKTIDEAAVCAALKASKDVDCITDQSLFGVFANMPLGFPPCTAEACILMLDHYGFELEGANVCVVGRSLVIGKPVSMMLQARNATVTMCHTRTRDLAGVCAAADILIVAAGHMGTIGADAVSANQCVLDVGINWDAQAGKLCGDVAFADVEPIVGAISPVPGGIGSVTTAVLAKHVVESAERTA